MEGLTKVWTQLSPIQSELLALPFAIFILWLRVRLQPKVKVIWGQATNSFHLFHNENGDNPKASIFTEKFYIQNAGRASAKNIEIIFKGKPNHINIFPTRLYEEETGIAKTHTVKIPYIPPKDLIIIDTVSLNGNPCGLESINCPDVIVRKVNFMVQRKYPTSINLFFTALFLAGIAFPISLLLRILGL